MVRGIAGALLLARGKPDGMDAFEPTMEDARASFLAASPGLGWSVDLRWQDNSANETGFTLERREGEGGHPPLGPPSDAEVLHRHPARGVGAPG